MCDRTHRDKLLSHFQQFDSLSKSITGSLENREFMHAVLPARFFEISHASCWSVLVTQHGTLVHGAVCDGDELAGTAEMLNVWLRKSFSQSCISIGT